MSLFIRACFVLLLVSAIACGSNAPTAPSTSGTPTRIIALSGNLTFGSVPVGQRSAPLMLTISNLGNSTLTVSGMAVPGGSLSSPGFSGQTISAGASHAFAITFVPTAAQDYSGVVTVNGDQTSGVNTIALSATGLSADIRLVAGRGGFSCDSAGRCSFSTSIQNVGSACASGTAVVARFFDGSGAQLGSDVEMDASGSLSSRIIRLQEMLAISSLAPVGSDSALNTKAYALVPTWTNVMCP
jgi:hypothetical protein